MAGLGDVPQRSCASRSVSPCQLLQLLLLLGPRPLTGCIGCLVWWGVSRIGGSVYFGYADAAGCVLQAESVHEGYLSPAYAQCYSNDPSTTGLAGDSSVLDLVLARAVTSCLTLPVSLQLCSQLASTVGLCFQYQHNQHLAMISRGFRQMIFWRSSFFRVSFED